MNRRPEIVAALSGLEGEDLVNVCQTTVDFKPVCQDENYWQYRLQLDYDLSQNPLNIAWSDLYSAFAYHQYQPYRLYLDDNLVGGSYFGANLSLEQSLVQLMPNLSQSNGLLMYTDEDDEVVSLQGINEMALVSYANPNKTQDEITTVRFLTDVIDIERVLNQYQ